MNILKAAPITIALLTVANGFVAATIAHYADAWIFAYLTSIGGALFAAMAILVAQGEL